MPSSCPIHLLTPFLFLPGRALQVQVASRSPPSAWPYVLDGPGKKPDLCQSPEPPEPCVHSRSHVEEYLSAGLQRPHPHLLVYSCISSLLLNFGYPLNCHLSSYLVFSCSPSPM